MFNEAASVPAFLEALRDGLGALTDRFEIVVVNDGSHDETRQAVLGAPADCGVVYLELSRNFGKEAALSAGLEAARGEVVVLIDGDGQHPVGAIATMLERWREGWDVAYGMRRSRDDEALPKRLGAAFFYKLIETGSKVDILAGAGDFRLMDRRVVEALKRLPERTRFMKGLYAWVGFRAAPEARASTPWRCSGWRSPGSPPSPRCRCGRCRCSGCWSRPPPWSTASGWWSRSWSTTFPCPATRPSWPASCSSPASSSSPPASSASTWGGSSRR
jgi:glycosyltransferase involved in cell wall biosynthesis